MILYYLQVGLIVAMLTVLWIVVASFKEDDQFDLRYAAEIVFSIFLLSVFWPIVVMFWSIVFIDQVSKWFIE